RRTGLSDREEKQLRGLLRRRNREQEGRFLAEGIRVVEDLLASDLVTDWIAVASSIEDSERGAALLAEVERRGIPRRIVAAERFSRLVPTEHSQGVVAIARIPATTWEMVDDGAARSVLLLLDGVQDPGNLGTLIRTTEALGGAGVMLLPGSVDAWNPSVVRSTAGASFRVPILTATREDALGWGRASGYRLLAAEAGGVAIEPADGRIALVMGNEGAG